jgi:hypothetical protein
MSGIFWVVVEAVSTFEVVLVCLPLFICLQNFLLFPSPEDFWLIIVSVSVLFHHHHSSDLFLTAIQFLVRILFFFQCAIE